MKSLTLPRLVTLITFSALFAMAVRTAADTDMYWHLRAGQFILQTRSVPMSDPFSWTAVGTPWVDVHWLSQVVLFSTYALSGAPGLALLVAALVVLAFVFVWKQMEGSPLLRAFIVVLAAVVAAAVWTPRSQMATFVLTPLVGYLVYLYKWRQIDRLWVIPLVFVLWVNMHGGYISGFMLLGAVLVGEMANHVLGFGGPEVLSWSRWRKLLIITLISGAALLINPYTINALVLPFKTVNIGVLQDFIQEWASPNFHELYQQPLIWMLLLTLVVIGWSGRRLDVTRCGHDRGICLHFVLGATQHGAVCIDLRAGVEPTRCRTDRSIPAGPATDAEGRAMVELDRIDHHWARRVVQSDLADYADRSEAG